MAGSRREGRRRDGAEAGVAGRHGDAPDAVRESLCGGGVVGKGEGQPRPDPRWEPREGETRRGGKENRKCGWRVEENGGRRFKRLENDITLERELHVAAGQKGKSRANWAQDEGAPVCLLAGGRPGGGDGETELK